MKYYSEEEVQSLVDVIKACAAIRNDDLAKLYIDNAKRLWAEVCEKDKKHRFEPIQHPPVTPNISRIMELARAGKNWNAKRRMSSGGFNYMSTCTKEF